MSPSPPTLRRGPKPTDPKERFLVELARALGTYGTSAHRLEECISVCAHDLGLVTHVFSTPTSVFISVERGNEYATFLSRVSPGEVNLSKLRALDELFNAVATGAMSPEKGTRKIKEIVRQPDRVPVWLNVLCLAMIALTASVLLGGGPREAAASTIAGLTVGIMLLFIGRQREYARLMEFVIGFLSAFVSIALEPVIGPFSPALTTLSAMIILLPGLTLTVAMTELATRNVVSGTARLVGALMILLMLGFGAAIGSGFGEMVFGVAPVVEPQSFSEPWKVAAALFAAAMFVIAFRARPSDCWIMSLGVLASYYGSRFGVEHFGTELGVCFAAACVGSIANFFARATDRPAATVMLPGLIMLVPGAVGFRSIQSLIGEDTMIGVQSAFSVLIIGAALVVGLLLANVIVSPRKIL